MLYVDCDCWSDHWKEFKDPKEAKEHFDKMECKTKILYSQDEQSGVFTTLEEVVK